MPDREKIIAQCEWAIRQTSPTIIESKTFYEEVLALLKEQAKTKVVFGRTKDSEFVTECGNCGTHLDKAYSNCPKCKKELDWNSNQT